MGENKITDMFQQSLLKKELSSFICGKGPYLVVDREYGGHCPLGSYKIYIEPCLIEGILPIEFWEQLSYSFDTFDDINILLDNLVAYFTPYYNCSDKELKNNRVNKTPVEIIYKIREILTLNKESLLKDNRGSGIEWNSKTGLWGGITTNLAIIRKRGGPNFLNNELI